MRPDRGHGILLQDEGVRIPRDLRTVGEFRRWVQSDAFPEKGRIDWVGGEMEIDMAPEDFNTHATPKAAVVRDLSVLVESGDLGVVVTDSSRLTALDADLSAEPDAIVLLFDSIEQGRVRLVHRPGGGTDRCAEIEGAPDIVVEVVSDSSEEKDRQHLKERYWKAGVREYWLVDVRGASPELTLYRHTRRGYAQPAVTSRGFHPSKVLGVAVRLVRRAARAGVVRYRLETCPL